MKSRYSLNDRSAGVAVSLQKIKFFGVAGLYVFRFIGPHGDIGHAQFGDQKPLENGGDYKGENKDFLAMVILFHMHGGFFGQIFG